ncbi:MAG: hypothetical protein ACFFHD_13090 [Promethearchaeota archaeon]
MMSLETLKELLDLSDRNKLHKKILTKFKNFSKIDGINYLEFETSEGKIPIITISKELDPNKIKFVKVFVGAQHNEYNGLFGILEFLNMIETSKISIKKILLDYQIIIFAPLMNPYGFLYPKKENKSGYFLKNGTNLNRYWRRTFVPDYNNGENDLNEFSIPEHAKIIKNLLEKYWENEDISIYILDFHETSLLKRFSIDLLENLDKDSITYKFSHWLKEVMIYNIIKIYDIPLYRKPLFYKSRPDANHSHINLNSKQLKIVYERFKEHIANNYEKLSFYFCYSNKSKKYCMKLAQIVYKKLKELLWETYSPAFDHHFQDHGCLVKMNDATKRKKVYSMELESEKHFFNIFEEIEKSKKNKNYFKEKLKKFNAGIILVIESIKEMIQLC